MHISEHPDFKQRTNTAYCWKCEKETKHKRGLRLNGGEFDPPEYNECTVCGRDNELDDDDEFY